MNKIGIRQFVIYFSIHIIQTVSQLIFKFKTNELV